MFYKFENNQLYCNGTIVGPLYEIYKESDGWYWFPDNVQALEFFNQTTYEGNIQYIDL